MTQAQRYYRVITDVSFNTLTSVLRIGPQDTPGLLEFWSPDCFTTWNVSQTEDGFANPETFRTGPASRSSIYLPRGGNLTCTVHAVSPASVNQYNGFIETGTVPAPQLVARFYPGLYKRPKVENQRLVVLSNFVGADGGAILGGGPNVDVAYPPWYSKTAACSTVVACTVNVLNIANGILQARGVNPTPGAFPFTCDPWSRLQVIPPGQDTDFNVLWAENLEVHT